MPRGKGIYDDEEGSAASQATNGAEKDPDNDTPDVDKNTDEPTA